MHVNRERKNNLLPFAATCPSSGAATRRSFVRAYVHSEGVHARTDIHRVRRGGVVVYPFDRDRNSGSLGDHPPVQSRRASWFGRRLVSEGGGRRPLLLFFRLCCSCHVPFSHFLLPSLPSKTHGRSWCTIFLHFAQPSRARIHSGAKRRWRKAKQRRMAADGRRPPPLLTSRTLQYE